jgi:IS30 family transposase
LRRYLPKKTDLSVIPEEEIQRIVSMINDKPRKILGYQTATEVALAGGVINRVS